MRNARKPATKVSRLGDARDKRASKLDDLDTRVDRDLARSGLTRADRKRMRVEALTAKEAKARGFEEREGYAIPYFEIDGRPAPARNTRIRYLEDSPTAKKPHRYGQLPNTFCRFYLPPFVDWKEIATDPSKPIVITEGEKKAAAACKAGIATIGFGGVENWSAKKAGLLLIPDFRFFVWKGRDVIITFDSDTAEKPQVVGAMNRLTGEIFALGAKPTFKTLPTLDGKTTGLDDFLLAQGVKAFGELQVEMFDAVSEVIEIDAEYAVIESPPAILRLRDRELVTRYDFEKVLEAHRTITVQTQRGQLKEPAAKHWLQWKRRQTFRRLVYEPGQPAALGDGSYNLWRPAVFEPRKATQREIDDIYRLQDHIFAREPEHIPWAEGWLAYPHQNPGAKLHTAMLLHGPDQGSGKTIYGELVAAPYGHNAERIDSGDLTASFNPWMAGKQFILGDEILGDDRRKNADRIKNIITSLSIRINAKYKPEYSIRNLANCLFTSNHPNALNFDDNDRRLFVMTVAGRLDQEFYNRVGVWIRSGNAGPAVLWYFLEKVDCSKFDPYARAPLTSSKREMAWQNDTSVKRWLREWLQNPEVGRGPAELVTPTEIMLVYNSTQEGNKWPTSSPIVGRVLAEMGVPQYELTNVKLGESGKRGLRLYAVRNAGRWARLRKGMKWEKRMAAAYQKQKVSWERGIVDRPKWKF